MLHPRVCTQAAVAARDADLHRGVDALGAQHPDEHERVLEARRRHRRIASRDLQQPADSRRRQRRSRWSGRGPRAMLNLIIVMFLAGLWHGAAWTFVVWGLLHGSYLAIERLFKALVSPPQWLDNFLVELALGLLTYLAVLIAWVYF